MTSLGKQFAQLTLAINEHLPGYVDSFFGPQEWADEIKTDGKAPLPLLKEKADSLYSSISQADDFTPQRKAYLLREMDALKMSLRLLSGEKYSLTEEVQALYDVSPQWKSESIFEEAQDDLDKLLPAGGTVAERLQAWNSSIEVSNETITALFPYINAHLRELTRKKFGLPEGEDFTHQFVTDQPWSAYNWYKGKYQSLIELNVDLPIPITRLPDLLAHEGYPGHHTELCIKEEKLINGLGWDEATVNLINTPSCVVSEAIATCALDIIMTPAELTDWFRTELLPRAGLAHINAEQLTAITHAAGKISGIVGNAAFMMHDQNKAPADIIKYLQHYGMFLEKQAERSVKFISSPVYRSYIFTYHIGRELLLDLFAKSQPEAIYSRLLNETVTPTMMREWAA